MWLSDCGLTIFCVLQRKEVCLMVEEMIGLGQYREALEFLEDRDDENVR